MKTINKPHPIYVLCSFATISKTWKIVIVFLLCFHSTIGMIIYGQNTPPSNDLCGAAQSLGTLVLGGEDSVTGNTQDATTNDAPDDCGSGVDNEESGGVWYTFTGTGMRFYEISTCDAGTTIDTEVSVYFGTCNNLTCLDGNDNDGTCTEGGGASSSTTTVSTLVDGGEPTNYYVYVKGQASSVGNFALNINDLSPTNDECFEATSILPPEGGTITLNGTNTFSTTADAPVNCGDGINNTDGPGVWYQFNPRPNSTYEISTCSDDTNFDTEVSVYRGTWCGGLFCETGNDDDGLCTQGSGGTSSTVTVTNPGNSPRPFFIYVKGNGGGTGDFEITVTEFPGELLLAIKAFLEGPYDPVSGLMNDDLRSLGLIPNTEPYNTDGATVDASVLAVSGADAIVDWVLVELRGQFNNTAISHSRTALLQRDGDIVDTDGVSPLRFTYAIEDNYFVSIRHRNHLGLLTFDTRSLNSAVTTIDFTNSATTVYGSTASRLDLGAGILGLYGADTNASGAVDATDRSNAWNDRNQNGYLNSDCDLNGITNATDRSITWNN
ncbi:MAG: hypothetical protein AAF985_05645, partial [Bacteroidota bacterium]